MSPRRLFALAIALLAGCSGSPQEHFNKGLAYYRENKFAKAAEHFQTAIAGAPPTAQALNFLGVCQLHDGKPAEASRSFEQALQLDSSHVAARYNAALAHLEQGHNEDAISDLRQLTQGSSWPPDTHYYLGLAYLRVSAWKQARQAFEKAGETETSSDLFNYLGIVNTRLGDLKQAKQDFERSIKSTPKFAPAVLNLAVLEHHHLGHKQEAISLYQQYLDLLPKSQQREDIRLTLVQLRDEPTQHPKPVEVATAPPAPKPQEIPKPATVIVTAAPPVTVAPPTPALAPTVVAAAPPPPAPEPQPALRRRTPISVGTLKAGNRAKATGFFNDGVKYQLQGKVSAAISSYTKATSTDPSFARAYYNLAIAYRDARQLDKALDSYELALAADPNYNDARFNYAILLQEQGYIDDAAAQYEKILKINPGDAATHLSVGVLYSRDRATWPKARQHFLAYLTLAPDTAPARDIRRWLDQNR